MSIKTHSNITISTDISKELAILLKELKPDKVAILVDENTKKHCLPLLNVPFDVLISIKSGEGQKNIQMCMRIWSELTNAQFTRKSLLINLGGGVINDMGGFVASTYKRGITFINLPTTLLAQVDASLGGKTGINFDGLKNHIGFFQNPNKIIVYVDFLNTLPKKQLRSGFAEIIKHTLIRSEKQWKELQTYSFDSMKWVEIIHQSIAIKKEIVNLDPIEKGIRKILNYGHTIGHALEMYFLETPYPLLHGEAIALGMILENKIAKVKGMINQKEAQRIEKYIRTIFDFPKQLPTYKDLKKYLIQDKKNDADGFRFSLLTKEGACNYNVLVEESVLKKILK